MHVVFCLLYGVLTISCRILLRHRIWAEILGYGILAFSVSWQLGTKQDVRSESSSFLGFFFFFFLASGWHFYIASTGFQSSSLAFSTFFSLMLSRM